MMETNYYNTWNEANSKRHTGEKIYREPGHGYYIVKPQKEDIFALACAIQ
jgi:hypothetical protein